MNFFTVEKIDKQLKELRQAVYRQTYNIPTFKYFEGSFDEVQARFPHGAGPEMPDFDDSGWSDFSTGSTWGGFDRLAWFRAWVPVPANWRKHKLALRFLVGPRDGGDSTAESMLYANGKLLQAIDVWHDEAWLPPETLAGSEVQIALKAWSGVLGVPPQRSFRLAQLVAIDEAAECFYFLADSLLKSIRTLPEKDLRRSELLQALNESFNCIDYLEPGSERFYDSLTGAEMFLEQRIARWQDVREIKPKVIGIGHAHIDMAWLWRLRHTREKGARTFTTVLHLMRQYPEYHFMHSSPQLYQYIKEDYPDLYERIRQKIAAGQWEITGGMWVEADTNLSSGESLVRQLLFGRRFVREEFGKEMKVLWLPDVFGYSAALPQILSKSGIPYFMTSKISWNQFNRFPYDTFLWRGLDGSEVLTHFVTTPDTEGSPYYTYNGDLSPVQVQGIWNSYQQKDVNHELLALFGWGDGGGGPTREMIESARALKNLPGMPEVEQGRSEDFFERLDRRLHRHTLPVWDGELYLEYHRGTYTSQAANKRSNRKAEVLYHDAEWLSSLADLLTGESSYPANQLRKGWELILLNQFHDILPGSSIHSVYEDSQQDYARVQSIGAEAVSLAEQRLASRLPEQQPGFLVSNSLSWPRRGLVELPAAGGLESASVLDTAGNPLPLQTVDEGGQSKLLVEVPEIPSLGYQAFPLVSQPAPAPDLEKMVVTPTYLENAFFRLELNSRGQLISVWDKRHEREALAPGERGNVFQAFEDKPMKFDAWDIDIYYQEKMREIDDLTEVVVEEAGPLRGVLRLSWRLAGSTITQRLTIYRSSPRIDFRTEIEWKQEQTLLKVAFPVDVRATRATYEVQFGSLERPTHWNTSWDYARFEVCAHKWVDLSEGGYGVALLNDCKYGHDVKDNVLRLTLIKSAIRPDPLADKGRHIFTYSLLPHAGDWRQGRVVEEAYALNYPLRAEVAHGEQPLPSGQAASFLGASFQFAEVSGEGVILETVKRAEDGDGWVIRIYESRQSRQQVSLRFGLPVRNAVECNLMEENEEPVAVEGNVVRFTLKPFEIKTFKVWF